MSDEFSATNAVSTPAMALRAKARLQLAANVDEGKVAYDLVHDARLSGVSDGEVRQIIAELRAEGAMRPL